MKPIKVFTEILVVCPSCKKSSMVSFKCPTGNKIIIDSDVCCCCSEDWSEDVIEQIQLDLEDILEYDDEIENIRQSEYNKHISNSIYEFFEN